MFEQGLYKTVPGKMLYSALVIGTCGGAQPEYTISREENICTDTVPIEKEKVAS